MTTYYISPDSSANGIGTSWSSAASIKSLPTLVAHAQPGDTILLRADEGSYNISSALNLRAGGTADQPITIKGVDRAGNDMNATFVSNRAADYSPTSAQGSEVFRLASGANHLVFANMSFDNVANAFHAAADVSDLTIRNMTADNVSRFLDDIGSGSGTATISGLNISNVDATGFAKGVIHLSYDTNNVVIDHVTGDGEFIDNGNFAEGIHLDGTAHNILIENSSISNILNTKTGGQYYNGDGFVTEAGNYGVTLANDYAHNNSDGGFDLKSSSTTLINDIADGNTRNFRFWADDTVAQGIVGVNPTWHGGISGVANVWLGTDAHATISNSSLYNGTSTSASLDLTDQGASVDLSNVVSDVSGSALARLSATSSLHGSVGAVSFPPPVWNSNPIASTAPVWLTGTAGNDILTGHAGNDHLEGGLGSDTLMGGYGMDTLYGNQGDDVLYGNQGNDILYGGQGNDTLYGGQNDDMLDGNKGDDILVGGLGNDTFQFDAGFGHDTITDFSSIAGNNDLIHFVSGSFANFSEVQAHMAQAGNDVVITLDDADALTVQHTTMVQLTADHFLFG